MSLILFGMEGQEGRVNTVYCHQMAPFCRKRARLAYAGGNVVLRPAISIAEESPIIQPGKKAPTICRCTPPRSAGITPFWTGAISFDNKDFRCCDDLLWRCCAELSTLLMHSHVTRACISAPVLRRSTLLPVSCTQNSVHGCRKYKPRGPSRC